MSVRQLQEMGDNLQLIAKRLQANQSLLKYLYYTDKNPLENNDLTEQQIKTEIFNKLIKIIPKLDPTETAKSVISLRVVRGRKLQANDEFQNIQIAIEVFVPLTQWFVKDKSLRPFLIMSEIEKSLENKTVNGLGKMVSGGFDLNFLTTEMACYEMTFNLVAYE